jgi:hypothetical protein
LTFFSGSKSLRKWIVLLDDPTMDPILDNLPRLSQIFIEEDDYTFKKKSSFIENKSRPETNRDLVDDIIIDYGNCDNVFIRSPKVKSKEKKADKKKKREKDESNKEVKKRDKDKVKIKDKVKDKVKDRKEKKKETKKVQNTFELKLDEDSDMDEKTKSAKQEEKNHKKRLFEDDDNDSNFDFFKEIGLERISRPEDSVEQVTLDEHSDQDISMTTDHLTLEPKVEINKSLTTESIQIATDRSNDHREEQPTKEPKSDLIKKRKEIKEVKPFKESEQTKDVQNVDFAQEKTKSLESAKRSSCGAQSSTTVPYKKRRASAPEPDDPLRFIKQTQLPPIGLKIGLSKFRRVSTPLHKNALINKDDL